MNIIDVNRNRMNAIDWDSIRKELEQYSGKVYVEKETKEKVKIDEKFINEFTRSKSTEKAKKTIKKLKINLIDCLEKIVENATDVVHEDNIEKKHNIDAKNGWDKYTLGFDYHTVDEFDNEKIVKYEGIVVIRCDENNEKYLYDVVGIKKRDM